MQVELNACSSTNRCQHLPTRLAKLLTLPILWTVLTYVNNYKYLGVWLDCKLSFQTHIKHLKSKIKSIIGFLFCNKASFTHAAKHTLVKLTILPLLDFGDVIYKIASNTLLSKLDAVYHSAICFVTKSPYTTHTVYRFVYCLFIPCVTLCCCLCLTALLYLGQVADVNENFFSTGLPT